MSASITYEVRCDCGWVGNLPESVRCPKCQADLSPWEPRMVSMTKTRTCTIKELTDAEVIAIIDRIGLDRLVTLRNKCNDMSSLGNYPYVYRVRSILAMALQMGILEPGVRV